MKKTKKCIPLTNKDQSKYDNIKKVKEEAELMLKDFKPSVTDDGSVMSKKFFGLKKTRAGVLETGKKESLSTKDKFLLDKFPQNTFLVEMFFSNGTSKEWVIKTNEETFEFKKRTYYLRYEDSRFALSRNQFKLFYHEDYCCPVDKEVLLVEDKEAVTEKKRAFFSTTPSNIKPLIEMQYVKGLVAGGDMNKYLKLCLVIIIIVALMLFVHVFKIIK